jgi:secondary thiamine-phosphate synthase enzyme
MKAHTASLTISTRGKGTYEITSEVARIVAESGVTSGLATVFLQHTSASLVIYENADPSARTDLHEFFERLVPEDADYLVHTAEGPDDSTSHLQMMLGWYRGLNYVRQMPARATLPQYSSDFADRHSGATSC